MKKSSSSSSSDDGVLVEKPSLPPPSEDVTAIRSPKDVSPCTTGAGDIGGGESAKRALKVVGATVGPTVGKTLASNALTTAALASIERLGTTAAVTTLVTKAQLQSMGLIALRLPLANSQRLEQFSIAVAEFTAKNEASIVQVTEMTAAEQVFAAGFQSNAVATLAAAAVQQSINTVYLCAGWSTAKEFKDASVAVALAGSGSLAGGVGGAAVGTLIVPGAGTVIGSLLGSFGGSFVPQAIVDRMGNTDPSGVDDKAHLRKLKCVEAESGEWLEILDQSETTQRFLEVDQVSLRAKTEAMFGEKGKESNSDEDGNVLPPPTLPAEGEDSLQILADPSGHILRPKEGEKTSPLGVSCNSNNEKKEIGSHPPTTRQEEGSLSNMATEDDGMTQVIECGPTDVILFLKTA